jgi:hypothetical protein
MTGATISNNYFNSTSTNGLIITTSGTGTWDYSILIGNNAHYCTGTKWSLSAGNAGGVNTNNITT